MDPDPLVRAMALETVGEFSSERATRLLASMLFDSDPLVRCAAASAAARARATGLLFSLIIVLDDPIDDVRIVAARTIEEITGRAIDVASLRDTVSRRQAIDQLKSWWKQRRLAELAEDLGRAS